MANDFTTENNPRYLYIAELHRPFPEWVANAPIPSASSLEKKAAAAFADPARRLLPITDNVATFLSAINLFAEPANFSADVFDRVKEACDFHGISEEVAPYADLFADRFEKSASEAVAPAGRFAIDTELDGQRYQLLPINDAYEVSESAEHLAKMASDGRIHFIQFASAAREIVKAAADHNASGLPHIVLRVGVDRMPNMEKAAKLIEGRAELATGDVEAVKAAYADALTDEDPVSAMNKIAAIDTSVGIRHRYDNAARLPLPSDIVFSGPLVSAVEKLAMEQAVIGNVLVPLTALKALNRDELDFKLSKAASESFSRVQDTNNATDISLLVEGWSDADRRTLLRIAAAS